MQHPATGPKSAAANPPATRPAGRASDRTESALQYPDGSVIWQTRSPALPLTVERTTYDASGRHRRLLCTGVDGQRVYAAPHHVVISDPAQRPTAVRLDSSARELTAAIRRHTADCRSCCEEAVFWGTARRCLLGKRLVDELGALLHYRDNVAKWLEGKPVDPTVLRRGQGVTVRGWHYDAHLRCHTRQAEFVGRFVEADHHGYLIVREMEHLTTAAYRAVHVFHAP
ncbi:hypothetical protein SLUN_00035 [Streptomyces lunaelactis]|uniref:Uncharacterized protein n=1 Tax=Streptomyces lunaelactis TaxID=1535768 RepID=A0A2R4SVI8_9ACTN|nr:hypothetical protein [Streptomyces lunaelactis]AVZ70893.1 hypothetical protein SLUN_00035 [Streptomyces lunaelactis]NUK26904.1 hypothetical protein [Streptomyces lunaelactis]NUK89765.1 hypothetical protein [Streptomyces lunaelactis]